MGENSCGEESCVDQTAEHRCDARTGGGNVPMREIPGILWEIWVKPAILIAVLAAGFNRSRCGWAVAADAS